MYMWSTGHQKPTVRGIMRDAAIFCLQSPLLFVSFLFVYSSSISHKQRETAISPLRAKETTDGQNWTREQTNTTNKAHRREKIDTLILREFAPMLVFRSPLTKEEKAMVKKIKI